METMSMLEDIWTNVQGYYEGFVAFIPKLVIAFITFSFFYFTARRLFDYVQKKVEPKTEDPLLTRLLSRLAYLVIIGIGLVIVLQILGLGNIAGGLFAGAGVGAVVFGFAFRDIGENFISGIMLAFYRPFDIGDIVQLEGIEGKVASLSLREIQIKTADGKDVFIPNSAIIKNPLINLTIDDDLRFDFLIGLDYGSEYLRAIDIILDTLNGLEDIMKKPKGPSVIIEKLNASTVDLRVYYWINAFEPGINAVQLKNQAINEVLHALEAEGFYMPSQVLEVKNYKESRLMAALPEKEIPPTG